ncbi:RNA dependent RNA polymerase-domain-containing protein [Xylariomycetidae sp. FL2044]|nr:RNA dependent RNA polymerase-domain-containing protein [Xylariomycetidae sp. FL2044]
MRPEWSTWPEVTLRLHGLPRQATLIDLGKALAPHGNIFYLELTENEYARRMGSGLVRFRPPPSTAFWGEGKVKIMVEGKPYALQPEVLPPKVAHAKGAPSLVPNKMQFGVLSGENEMMSMRAVRNLSGRSFFMTAEPSRKMLEVGFACSPNDLGNASAKEQAKMPATYPEYKMQIPFDKLQKIVFVENDEEGWSLLISMPTPPIFFRKIGFLHSLSAARSSWNERDSWPRAADITCGLTSMQGDAASLHRAHHFIDIGRWTTYKMTFVHDSDRKKWEETIDTAGTVFLTVSPSPSSSWDIFEPSEQAKGNLALLSGADDVHLDFPVRYQLEVCISRGILQELAELSSRRTARRDRAKDLLTYGLAGKIDTYRIFDPMSIFDDPKAVSHYPALAIPDHCVWIRKVIPSNRVLRFFSAHSDLFLRVQFSDEPTSGRIHPEPQGKMSNALFNRIYRTLANGVKVGGRHFQFLAYGNSQFRENGAYFFSETGQVTCAYIRDWMGEVKHIRCFSTTRAPKGISLGYRLTTIPDIERHGWCFTDGVGKIAGPLAQDIATKLKLLKRDAPSAYQFRLGGSKGLLVVCPDLSWNELQLRPSQMKFMASGSRGIEIIKASRFSVATLNRQTITLLSALGVRDEVFTTMLKRQVSAYDRAMEDEKTAVDLLNKFVDQNGTTTEIAQMIVDGFMRTKEPFLMTTLQIWRAWSMKLLKEKARIVVDKGAFLLGCVDETGTLRGHKAPRRFQRNGTQTNDAGAQSNDPQANGIFIQVPKQDLEPGEIPGYTVITGVCVVGRNPSLHPGDIRVVEAVDVPELRHLRDVVVFPANGDRDIPSMCSGGDLDGDDFFVFWDPELIPPPEEWNHRPMIHDTLKPKELNRNVEVDDLFSFFVTYMKNDSLSSIALAHLAKADALKKGPKDPMCIELAQLHSSAVDYPKSGEPAHLNDALRPKRWPHFMERRGRSYHSTSALGKLYDMVSKVEFKPENSGAFDERILRRFALSDEELEKARIIKRQYDKATRQIMNQHEIGTEYEVWTTFVLSKPRFGSGYKIQEDMGPIISAHRERFRKVCIKVAGSPLYRVTWEEIQYALQAGRNGVSSADSEVNSEKEKDPEGTPLTSFPWVFDRELGRIAKMGGDLELSELPKLSASSEDILPDEFERLVGTGVFDELDDDLDIEDDDTPVEEFKKLKVSSEQDAQDVPLPQEEVEFFPEPPSGRPRGIEALERMLGN